MKNSVLKPAKMRESTSLEFEINKSYSLTQKKYQAVLNTAQGILHGDIPHPSIQDSLNCGKLGKLICYIRNGGFCMLLWGCYTQQLLNMQY